MTGKFGVDALHRSVEALNMALQLDPSSVLYWRNFAGKHLVLPGGRPPCA